MRLYYSAIGFSIAKGQNNMIRALRCWQRSRVSTSAFATGKNNVMRALLSIWQIVGCIKVGISTCCRLGGAKIIKYFIPRCFRSREGGVGEAT